MQAEQVRSLGQSRDYLAGKHYLNLIDSPEHMVALAVHVGDELLDN